MQDYIDFVVILFLLLINGVIGLVEERRAGDAIAALKSTLAQQATVCRGGKWYTIEAADLVPGDLIRLCIGDLVPADAILHNGKKLEVDQSGITGESLPVSKRSKDAVFAGSTIKIGEMTAVVDKTGYKTTHGRSAKLIQRVENRGHFQKVVFSIALVLMIISILLVTIILFVGLTAKVETRKDPIELVELCLVIIVASIPIALPAVTTGTMAVGARKLAKAGAVTRRLTAIEELAGMEVLCVDKTGTLTKNELTIDTPWLNDGVSEEELFLYASLSASEHGKEPIEKILSSATDISRKLDFKQVGFEPFDPVSKRTCSDILQLSTQRRFTLVKGAPQVLFSLEELEGGAVTKEKVERVIDNFASRGLRSVGVAKKEASEVGWKYLGIVPLYDPPRADSKQMLEDTVKLGVNVKMLTGDHLGIAKDTCTRLSLGNKIYSSEFFNDMENRSKEWKNSVVEAADGFAEVFPEHKFGIVEILQENGHLVGMTGDGVNDAPALKRANVGIAVKGSTDAARAAADIILFTSGLGIIITAITTSRMIFQRMKNYIIYRINDTTSILGWMFIGIVFLDFTLPPIVIVFMVIVNDFTILSGAYDHVLPSSRPEKWRLAETISVGLVIGLLSVIQIALAYYCAKNGVFLYSTAFTPEKLKMQTYFILSCTTQLSAFVCRTRGFMWSRVPGFGLAIAVVGAVLFVSILSLTWPFKQGLSPLSLNELLLSFLFVLFFLFTADLTKVITYLISDRVYPHHEKAHKGMLRTVEGEIR